MVQLNGSGSTDPEADPLTFQWSIIGAFVTDGVRTLRSQGMTFSRKFRENAVRLQLHALAYNIANFMRTLALPKEVEHWSLTTLREKLVKIGAKVVRHGRYITFQMAEVAIPRLLFAEILHLIDGLRPAPLPP